MANLSSLAVRVSMNYGQFTAGAIAIADTVAQVAQKTIAMNGALSQSTQVVDRAATSFDRLTQSAKGYLGTILGIGAGGAMIAKSVRTFSTSQSTERDVQRKAGGGDSNIPILADAWSKLSRTVDKAYEAFGRAFSQSANLMETMRQVTSVVQQLTPFLFTLGNAFGVMFDWLVNTPPVLLFLIAAIKILTVAASALASILITRLLVGMATYALLGTWMTPLTLALAAAQWVWNAACFAGAVAMAALQAGGILVWAVIGAAIAAVALILWGLVEAWKWLTGAKITFDIPGLSKTSDEVQKISDAADKMASNLKEKIATFGWSDRKKELVAYAEELDKLQATSDLTHEGGEAALKEFARQQQTLAHMEKQAELVKQIAKAQADAKMAGQSDQTKKLMEFAQAGANVNQVNALRDALSMQEKLETAAKNRKELAEQLAKLEKEAAQAGLSEAEKKLALAKELGASAETIRKLANADATANIAKMEADAQKKAAQAGMSEQQKAIADYATQLRALEGLSTADYEKKLASFTALQKQAEETAQIKKDLEATKSPLDKYQERIDAITRLLATGNLTAPEAMNAADQAQKTLNSSFGSDTASKLESPKALLKGTAEAALAENRAQSPIEKQTELQKQQLEEAKKSRDKLNDIAQSLSEQNVQVAQF